MNRSSMVTTRAGITIGSAWIEPPPRDIGSEAEKIQTALLAKPRRFDWINAACWAISAGAMGALLFSRFPQP